MNEILYLRDASSEDRRRFVEEKLSMCLAVLSWECNYEYNKWDISPRLKCLEKSIDGLVVASDAMLEASKAAKAWKEMGRV